MTAVRRPTGALARLGAVLATAWLAMIGGLLFWTVAPMAVGWQPRLVLSGSMAPSLRPGDVVLTAPVDAPLAVLPGQVLAVAAPDLPSGSYLHRVVRRDPGGRLVTRGDANDSDDFPAVAPERVLGRLQVVVPVVGHPVLALRQGDPVPYAVVALLTGASVWALRGRAPEPRHARAGRRPG